MYWILLSVIAASLLLYNLFFRKKKNFFKENDIPYISNRYLGVFWKSGFFLEHITDTLDKIYNDHMRCKSVLGCFLMKAQFLIIKDLEMIKRITIKDFDHFVDRSNLLQLENEPIFTRNVFSLCGQEWHKMRTTLTPSFTASKMKLMFDLIMECGQQLSDYYVNEATKLGSEEIIKVKSKEIYTRFTCDVIATSAFGLKVDSFKNKDNTFYIYGKDVTSPKFVRGILFTIIPRFLQKMIGFRLLPEIDYFSSVILDAIKTRENGVVRPDMVHLLLEARKKTQSSEATEKNENILTNEDIIAQAFVFFIAGFETTALALCYASYELAINPDVQHRLYEEIEEMNASCNGKIDYESMQKMKYLNMVISETLRKWPPAIFLNRHCTKPYKLETENGTINLDTSVGITIPVWNLQRDPKYFSRPELFDPERFSDENKINIHPCTYLPFGIGPRNCIGSRFVLMEMKIALFHMLKNFELVPIKDTPIPFQFINKSMDMNAKGGFALGLKLRKEIS